MKMTPLQCRLARAATGWSAERLAAAAGLSTPTVTKFEKGGASFARSVHKMMIVLQYAGVEFLPAEEGLRPRGEGIRFTPPKMAVVTRLRSELDEARRQLTESKLGQPQDDGTLQSIRQAAGIYAKTLHRLEDQVADLENRIAKLIEMDA